MLRFPCSSSSCSPRRAAPSVEPDTSCAGDPTRPVTAQMLKRVLAEHEITVRAIFSGEKATFSVANVNCSLYPDGEESGRQVRNMAAAMKEIARLAAG